MMDIDIQTIGAERSRAAFVRLANNIKDMRPVWKNYIGFHTHDLVEKAFATNGQAMTGKTWPKYSKAYKIRKRKLGGQLGKMLVLSGKLKDAATGGTGFSSKIEKQKMTMTLSGLPYIRVHQLGFKDRNIPARAYFFKDKNDLPPRAYAYLYKATENHLKDGVK
jgi:phage gpG-like protein